MTIPVHEPVASPSKIGAPESLVNSRRASLGGPEIATAPLLRSAFERSASTLLLQCERKVRADLLAQSVRPWAQLSALPLASIRAGARTHGVGTCDDSGRAESVASGHLYRMPRRRRLPT